MGIGMGMVDRQPVSHHRVSRLDCPINQQSAGHQPAAGMHGVVPGTHRRRLPPRPAAPAPACGDDAAPLQGCREHGRVPPPSSTATGSPPSRRPPAAGTEDKEHEQAQQQQEHGREEIGREGGGRARRCRTGRRRHVASTIR